MENGPDFSLDFGFCVIDSTKMLCLKNISKHFAFLFHYLYIKLILFYWQTLSNSGFIATKTQRRRERYTNSLRLCALCAYALLFMFFISAQVFSKRYYIVFHCRYQVFFTRAFP